MNKKNQFFGQLVLYRREICIYGGKLRVVRVESILN